MQTSSSAKRTWSDSRSASEKTATVRIPSSLQARMTRSAISPRLAISTFRNMSDFPPARAGVEGQIGGCLDAGRPQRELRGIRREQRRALVADQAPTVQLHQALIEGLHSVLCPSLGDEIR